MPYAITCIDNSTSSLFGNSSLYYPPPDTSYTIAERAHSSHYYFYNTVRGSHTKGGSLPNHNMYLGPSSTHQNCIQRYGYDLCQCASVATAIIGLSFGYETAHDIAGASGTVIRRNHIDSVSTIIAMMMVMLQ